MIALLLVSVGVAAFANEAHEVRHFRDYHGHDADSGQDNGGLVQLVGDTCLALMAI